MGAYDNPRIIRDTSGQIYGQAIANFGQQIAGGMKAYYANQKAEQAKADKEIERLQRIANQVESRFYDQANRNYALVAREDKTLLKGFQNEVGNLLNGVGIEGEEGYQIGAIKAQTYLDTKNDLTKEERQYYREVVQRAKTFQNNAIAGGGQIINDLQDMNKVKPSDIASTHYWTGANDTERDTTMLTAYALDGKEVDGVASEKKIYSGRNGEMIVKVTSKVKEGSKTWNNLSEETQEHLRNNNYELTWEKDMNNFEELIGEVPEGLDYNQVSENSKFQKDGKLNSNFIVGGDEGSQYTTKSVIGGKKEEITSLRFLNINKLLNDETFQADIKGKAEGFVNMDNGKLNAFMRYTMKDGSFKITEFREKTPQEQEKYIQEALRQSFINEKTSGKNMGSKQADPRDVAHFEKLGVAIEEGETVYYQITGRNVVNKQSGGSTGYDPSIKGDKIIARIKTDPEKFTREILDFDSQEDITVEGKSKTSNGILKITTDTLDPETEEIVEEIQSYNLDDPSDIRRYVRKLAEYDKSYSTGNDKGKSVLDYLLAEAENIKGFVESKVNNKEKMENLKAVPIVIENLSNIENFDTLTNRAGKVVPSRNRRSKERKAYAEAKSIIEKQLENITQEELEKQISDASDKADAEGKDEFVISLQKKLNLIRNITGVNLDGKLYKKDK